MSNAYRAVVQSGGGAAVGDATAADVLTGKTFSGAVGSGVSGTMPNQGAVSGTATPTQPYTIPAGYHNGSGVVSAAVDLTDLKCSAVHVQSGSYSDAAPLTMALPKTTSAQYILVSGITVSGSSFTQAPSVGDDMVLDTIGHSGGFIILDENGNLSDYSASGITKNGSNITTTNNFRGGNWLALYEI